MKKILNTLDVSDIPEFSYIFNKIGKLVNIEADRNKVLKEIIDADVYLASASIKIDDEFLNNAHKLKVIGSPSTGTDHMNLELVNNKGIVCFDISKEFELINSFTATSELVFTLLLALLRKLVTAIGDTEKGIWSREKHSGLQLYGKNFGIIGLGRLGNISARIAKGFGMNVLAYDINDKNKKNIKMVDLDTLAKESDFVSIHVHLNETTEGMINKNFFSKMKSSAIIINTSRGKIINETDLLDALNKKLIAAAGLDVIDGEWLSKNELYNHPLIKYSRHNNNLLITPHIGGSTKESIKGARMFMAKKVALYIQSF